MYETSQSRAPVQNAGGTVRFRCGILPSRAYLWHTKDVAPTRNVAVLKRVHCVEREKRVLSSVGRTDTNRLMSHSAETKGRTLSATRGDDVILEAHPAQPTPEPPKPTPESLFRTTPQNPLSPWLFWDDLADFDRQTE